jgi:inosose dehydratase
MKLGFNEATALKCKGQSLIADLELCEKYGYDFIEIRADCLKEYLKNHTLEELATWFKTHRLKPGAYNTLEFFNLRDTKGIKEIDAEIDFIIIAGNSISMKMVNTVPSFNVGQIRVETIKEDEEVEKEFLKCRDYLYDVGARVIGTAEQGHSIQTRQDLPILEAKPYFTDAEWRNLCEGLNKLGKLAVEKGMKLTYHHHMGTGVQTAAEIDRLMENTEPDLLGLLYDTGHLAFSGEDYLAVLDKWVSRIRHVHLKNMRPAVYEQTVKNKWSFIRAIKEGVFTVPGDGYIDFVPIFDRLKKAGYSGWWVVEAEQDPAKANSLEYAIKARRYIKEKANI